MSLLRESSTGTPCPVDVSRSATVIARPLVLISAKLQRIFSALFGFRNVESSVPCLFMPIPIKLVVEVASDVSGIISFGAGLD